ncbi:MAG: glycine--tRNA ligase subunit beta [Firmicutes bacterium]|nr:glycine--tRNA ligase subunit beta [Bacillota bacterium]
MSTADLRDAVLEIGAEEIPARFIQPAVDEAARILRELLSANRLHVQDVRGYGSPRRLVLYLSGVSTRQSDLERLVRGPASRVAFDAEGNPTKAAVGFARSAGVAVSDLKRRETEQGEYVFARVVDRGEDALSVLASVFPKVIFALSFPKSMRWGSSDFRFARPIRWIVALLGEDVVDFQINGVAASRLTAGHRTLSPGWVEVPSASEYFSTVTKAGIMVDQIKRRESISEQARALAAERGGQVVLDPDLLSEVTYIVEWPTAFLGQFDSAYLNLPEACVITPMKDHQRYFPVRDGEGKLLPVFIGVRNGGRDHLDTVRVGNEKVLAARLADAKFFFEEDTRRRLSDRVDDLKNVVFQEKLGTMYDKSVRDAVLGREVLAGSDQAEIDHAERAALLLKTDLVTSMVREFTELQGVMGREYARIQGEPGPVADAIYEHYLPRFSGDALPKTKVGAALAIADKLDTVVGYFGIGLVPTGSADPYALRRQAAGAVAVHAEWRFEVGLDHLVERAARLFAEAAMACRPSLEVVSDVMSFLAARLKVSLEEEGIRYDVADAVLASGISHPARVYERARAVAGAVEEGWFAELATSFTRVKNIAGNAESDSYDPDLFEDPREGELALALGDASRDVAEILGRTGVPDAASYRKALERMSAIRGEIDRFFDAVMVMAPDPAIRANRLGLLKSVENALGAIADLSKIVFSRRES